MEYGWDTRDYWIRNRRRNQQRRALKRPGDPFQPPDWVLGPDGPFGAQYAALDLDFVYNRGYLGTTREESTAASLLTCSRNSIGTYTTRNGRILNFTANQLRIGNRGILVEESRENIGLRSQAFETPGVWVPTNGGGTVADDGAIAAPDGTM